MLLSAACSGGGAVSAPADTLVEIDGRYLTRTELARHLPAGMTPDDSTAFARAYIRSWIDSRLIATVAADEVDMDEVNRLTEEYRNDLIMSQYRRTMARQASDGIFSEDSLRGYYDSHQSDFVTERAMVRGVYLKVPDDAANLASLRKLYKSDRPVDIDRLEKAALGSAIHYDYFRDRWVDREQIENRIPVDADRLSAALTGGRPLDVSIGGFVYLLSVSDYMPAGSVLPFEDARARVRERMLAAERLAYDVQLRNDMLRRALDDGKVIFPGVNPLK